LLKLNSVHCHDASPWVNAPIIRPSVAHHMSLYVKNYTQLRHVTNQVVQYTTFLFLENEFYE
ncbi:MAG: hypothetical protein Q7U50_01440, partial [Candidatus Nitrotoga sp.]|nr:hypothetical protein [Candidatus Nitrotoga sp.]